jgi:hypothetical protein
VPIRLPLNFTPFLNSPIPAIPSRATLTFPPFATPSAPPAIFWTYFGVSSRTRRLLANYDDLVSACSTSTVNLNISPPPKNERTLAGQPAHAVHGPKHVVIKGRTPVLNCEEARPLLSSIDTSTLTGLRDRALIAVMIYTFARVGAVHTSARDGADGYACTKKAARNTKHRVC